MCLRYSVVSLQLGCCKASPRLAKPFLVIFISSSSSLVSLQLGCCKASHRLATPLSVILLLSRYSVVNFLTNLFKTLTYSLKLISHNTSSDTRQCSLFSELQNRCIPERVRSDLLIYTFLTLTNLSEHLCCASPASSLFSSLIMSNTNDTPMQSTSDKSPKAMRPSELQNACGLFLMNFLANSLF